MALIVEDGTGKTDSESYASVAQADDYHAKRNNVLWADLSLPEKEAALRKATDYIEQTYYGRFAGYRNREFQALDWPRAYVPRDPSIQYPSPQALTTEIEGYFYPFNEIPLQLIQATIELALKASEGDLLGDVERVTKREEVGSIKVEYEGHKSPNTTYPSIDRLLSRFFGSGLDKVSNAFSAKLVRS